MWGVTGPSDVTLTLEDDDTRGVTVSETELGVDEGDSNTYTVELDSEPTGPVTVTPVRSGDSDVSVSAALSFTALNWDAPQTVTVRAGQDVDALNDTAEIDHTVSGGDYESVTAASLTVTVDDDETDSSGVTLSVSPDSVSEAADATVITVTATLNGGARDSATPVSVTVASGTAVSGTDFTAVTGFTITIAANNLSRTGSFSLSPVQDDVDEPAETVKVNGATPVVGISVTGAEVEITDDDDPPVVTLALSSTSISEAGGIATVTASLSHASSEATTLMVSVPSANSSDYSLSGGETLSIAAGSTSSSGTVIITASDNKVDASNKSVAVSASVTGGMGIAAPADVTLTITDDDTRGVTVSETTLSIGEGEDGTYTVVLNSQPTGAVTVTPAPSNNSDGDVSVSAALDFDADNWATVQTVTVSAAGDADAVNDQAEIDHTVSGADYASVMAASVTVTVNDDETASTEVTLSVSPVAVGEGADATTVTVTAMLNSGSRNSATEVAVTVGSDTAVSGTDFATVTGFTITIAADQVSETGTFLLTPTDDTVDEPNETVSITGSVEGLTVSGTGSGDHR